MAVIRLNVSQWLCVVLNKYIYTSKRIHFFVSIFRMIKERKIDRALRITFEKNETKRAKKTKNNVKEDAEQKMAEIIR